MERVLLTQGKANSVLKILNEKLSKVKQEDPVNLGN